MSKLGDVLGYMAGQFPNLTFWLLIGVVVISAVFVWVSVGTMLAKEIRAWKELKKDKAK